MHGLSAQGSGCSVAAVVSPYAPAEGPSEPLHRIVFVRGLLLRYQTLNVATVPHEPAPHRQQHQQSPRIHQQVTKITTVHLKWDEDSNQEDGNTKDIHEDCKHQDKLTVGQSGRFSAGHGDSLIPSGENNMGTKRKDVKQKWTWVGANQLWPVLGVTSY